MKERTIKGTYGRGTPCTVFTYGQWYAVKGSCNANKAPDYHNFSNGPVDVEQIEDVDTFTWCEEINSLEDLIEAVEA